MRLCCRRMSTNADAGTIASDLRTNAGILLLAGRAMRDAPAWLSLRVRNSRRLHADPVTDTLPGLHTNPKQHPLRWLHGYAITDTYHDATAALTVLHARRCWAGVGARARGTADRRRTAECVPPPVAGRRSGTRTRHERRHAPDHRSITLGDGAEQRGD